MYKRLISLFLLLLFAFTLSGCSLFSSGETQKKPPPDTEVLEEGTGEQAESADTEEEKMLDLKSLNYTKSTTGNKTTDPSEAADQTVGQEEYISGEARENSITVTPPVVYKPDYRIHFLSEDEAKLVNEKLIKLGYLKEPAKNDKEFADAIYRFQQDEKIGGSGDINPETFNRLRSK